MDQTLENDIDKLIKVVTSCQTPRQVEIAEKYLDLFQVKWSKKTKNSDFFLVFRLLEEVKTVKSLISDIKTEIFKKNLYNSSKN